MHLLSFRYLSYCHLEFCSMVDPFIKNQKTIKLVIKYFEAKLSSFNNYNDFEINGTSETIIIKQCQKIMKVYCSCNTR